MTGGVLRLLQQPPPYVLAVFFTKFNQPTSYSPISESHSGLQNGGLELLMLLLGPSCVFSDSPNHLNWDVCQYLCCYDAGRFGHEKSCSPVQLNNIIIEIL